MRDLFETEPKTRRLNEYHELPTHTSEALAFRVQPATEDEVDVSRRLACLFKRGLASRNRQIYLAFLCCDKPA